MQAHIPSIVFVGGGPRTAGLLERLAANRPGLLPGAFHVHVVEPYAPGSGRIWRNKQDAGLMLNSTAGDVTMFTDASVVCDGPASDGPGLAAWAAALTDGTLGDAPALVPELLAQARELTPDAFPTRQLQGAYLEWFFRRSVAALGGTVTVHRDTATAIHPGSAGWVVDLAGGTSLAADTVVLAVGHTDAEPGPESSAWLDFARRHGGFHAPPAYTTDVDYGALEAGQDVIVSGMGLAFVDLAVLLMEGRGGRFEESDGVLSYVPSGAEPRLWAGSRRGVPYHSKVCAPLRGPAPGKAEFFTGQAVAELLAGHDELDFRTQLWPLIAKEAGNTYYRELLAGSPERASMTWEDFSQRYAELDWYSHGRAALVAAAVPDTALHLDFERLDRPWSGRQFASSTEVQHAVAAHIAEDLRLRDGGDNPETTALFHGLLRAYMDLGSLVPGDRLNAASHQTIHGWWHGYFSFVDSGPPPHRLRQLIALHQAGLLHFLGPELKVSADESTGQFVASSPQVPGEFRASAFIQARLPAPAVEGSASPVLRQLHASSTAAEQLLLTADGAVSTGRLQVSGTRQVVGPRGESQPGLFAVGAGTSAWGAGAFARPNTNAAPFRENDAVARTILLSLAAANLLEPALLGRT